ncbi:plasmid partitioning protein RepB C-terminal domain-containing protein, partial [Sinorhizobium meliloti]
MIARAIERGVSSADIADALGLQSPSFAGSVCWKASARGSRDAERHTPCSMKVFDVLRQMNAVRQIEAADLMIGQHNFTLMFARAIRAATPHSQLVAAKKMTGAAASTPPGQQIARMERELAALQTQVKSVEETYGIDNLHLTVARGYVAKLLANTRITRWLSYHRQEYLGEFQKIA